MIDFLLKIKLLRKCKTFPTSNGMTYVELIVVLGIFATLSAVVLFNYGDFQSRVDIKNLASDIASKIVEAQKSSIDGKWSSGVVGDWKPAYGVAFFQLSQSPKQFMYFADLDNSNTYQISLEDIQITKGNFISRIDKCTDNNCTEPTQIISNFEVIFTRPSSSAFFVESNNPGNPFGSVDHVQITIESPKGAKGYIKIYPSGRVQVN